jgi:serine/threonine protein phosphatase PrpC
MVPRREPSTSPPAAVSGAAQLQLLKELLRRTHLSAPSDVGEVVADQAASIGASEVVVYLIDYEQTALMPLGRPDAEPLSVAGTLAGRAFRTTTIVRAAREAGDGERLWVPLLDGTERLGIVGMSFTDGTPADETLAICERYAHLVALLLVTKGAYGDSVELTRRRHRMTIASELLWALVPPLVFATDRLVVAGLLEPCYDNGGDAFDYAANGDTLSLAVFDAMGHGLAAAGIAAFALSAYRHSRRGGCDLLTTYEAMDAAVGEQFLGERYVTALIAELDLDTGRLAWISAGHPPPLVIRDGRHARSLGAPPTTPLGVEAAVAPTVAEASLEPGDLLLLYTDGLTEARRADGTMFTTEGLSEFIVREAAAGQTAPETLRRLRHAIVDGSDGALRDDASALLVEWGRDTERMLMPQTVL